MTLESGHIAVCVFTDDDRCTAIPISCRNHAAIGGKDKHRDRTPHLIIHILYAVNKVLALRDKQRYELCRVGVAVTQLREVLFTLEALLLQLLDVGDLSHRDDGELAEM